MKRKTAAAFLLAAALTLSAFGCAPGEQPPALTGDAIPVYGGENVKIEERETYENTMTLPEQWEDYGIGDPYIMKYNGLFYLYVSTPYGKTGIKVWSSRNAADWEYRGIIAEDRNSTYTAYSPKVLYDNGTFYLYTAPDGNGLHILTAPTPLGPFTDISGVQHPIERQDGRLVPCDCKVHSSIDASIFIDDDGQWYLGHGHANDGIEYHKMTSPTEIDPAAYYPGTVVAGNEGNKWTETGEIFRRDDTYYMTFSGNHVANDSYRTNWASGSAPLTGYTLGDLPLLTSTRGELKGTGCGLVFTGANLVSDYVVYHNLINPKIGPIRGLNIDRVAYNGGEMTAYGPTDYLQEKQSLPTSYDYLTDVSGFTGLTKAENGFGIATACAEVFYRAETNAGYVAESNYNAEGGEAVFYFSYTDENRYTALTVSETGGLTLTRVSDGKAVSRSAAVAGYDAAALHTVRADTRGGRIQVYLDGMRKFNLTEECGGGKLGYRFERAGQVGYTAFTQEGLETDAAAAYKNATGKIFAKDYVKADSAENLTLAESGSGKAVFLPENAYARYRMNTGAGGTFAANVTYRAAGDGVLAFLDQDSKILGTMSFSGTDGKLTDGACSGISLAAGYDVVTVAPLQGNITLNSFQFYPQKAVPESAVSAIGEDGFTVMDGKWTSLSGTVKSYDVRGKEQANLVYGDTAWGDYAVSVDVKVDAASSGRAGILFRVRNIAENTGSVQQIFAFNDQSYYLSLDTNGYVELYKHNYNSDRVAVKRIDYTAGQVFTLKAVCRKNRFSVYGNGALLFEYTDGFNPFLTGCVGLHSESCTAAYTNFRVWETEETEV